MILSFTPSHHNALSPPKQSAVNHQQSRGYTAPYKPLSRRRNAWPTRTRLKMAYGKDPIGYDLSPEKGRRQKELESIEERIKEVDARRLAIMEEILAQAESERDLVNKLKESNQKDMQERIASSSLQSERLKLQEEAKKAERLKLEEEAEGLYKKLMGEEDCAKDEGKLGVKDSSSVSSTTNQMDFSDVTGPVSILGGILTAAVGARYMLQNRDEKQNEIKNNDILEMKSYKTDEVQLKRDVEKVDVTQLLSMEDDEVDSDDQSLVDNELEQPNNAYTASSISPKDDPITKTDVAVKDQSTSIDEQDNNQDERFKEMSEGTVDDEQLKEMSEGTVDESEISSMKDDIITKSPPQTMEDDLSFTYPPMMQDSVIEEDLEFRASNSPLFSNEVDVPIEGIDSEEVDVQIEGIDLLTSSIETPRDTVTTTKPSIKVIGLGDGGIFALEHMLKFTSPDDVVEFWAVNSDAQSFNRLGDKGAKTLLIGPELTQGLGAGGNPLMGMAAAEESIDQIAEIVAGVDVCFITAALGSGTGCGAAPVIAEISKASGALTIAIVTMPFPFEGKRRLKQARESIEKLRDSADSVVMILNRNLLDIIPGNMSLEASFRVADEMLRRGVEGIADMIKAPGLLSVDHLDLVGILQGSGVATMGIGTGRGKRSAEDAAMAAITSPLLFTPVSEAKKIALNIVGGEALTLQKVNEAARIICGNVYEDANIVVGAKVNKEFPADKITVTVIATGFQESESE